MREAKPRGRGRVDLLQPSTLSLQPPSQTASSPSQPKTHFTSLHKILSSLLHSSSPPSTGPKNPKGDPPLPLNRRSPSLKPTVDPDSIALSQASHRRQLHQRSPLLKGSPPVGWPPLPQPPPPPQAVAPLAAAPPCSLSELKHLTSHHQPSPISDTGDSLAAGAAPKSSPIGLHPNPKPPRAPPPQTRANHHLLHLPPPFSILPSAARAPPSTGSSTQALPLSHSPAANPLAPPAPSVGLLFPCRTDANGATSPVNPSPTSGRLPKLLLGDPPRALATGRRPFSTLSVSSPSPSSVMSMLCFHEILWICRSPLFGSPL